MKAQAGRLRIVFAVVFLVVLIGAENGIGALAASNYQKRTVTSARVDLERAHAAFLEQLDRSLADGTPAPAMSRWEIRERAAHTTARSLTASGFVDGMLVADLRRRTAAIDGMRSAVELYEVSVEASLRDQLLAALDQLRALFPAAHQAGVDITKEADWVNQEAVTHRDLTTPAAAELASQDVQQHIVALTNATVAQVATNVATALAAAQLAAARNDALYAQQRADYAVAQARATGVLDVVAAAAAIQGLESQLAGAASVDSYEAIAQGLLQQARGVESLVGARRSAFGLLAQARAALARAQSVRADTSGIAPRLDAAAAQLSAAATLSAIIAAADQVKNITTALDGAYAEALAHPPPPAGAIVMNMPFYPQIYSLDCEEAALQMALAYQGIAVSQDQVIAAVGVDRTPPSWDGAGNLHWGDPYAAFVGDPNGYREGTDWGARSGYGTYFPTIAAAASSFGAHVLVAGEQVAPATLYDAVAHNHPAVVWVAYLWSPHGTSTYVANDGRRVMYGAPWEHAVAVAGVANASILINNPHGGPQWIDKATFEASYAMFDNMAVILK